MAKRIVTKVGDVFTVVIDNEYRAYFQFIAIDGSNMNSDTIRVFKRRYSLNYAPSIEDVVADEVLFYTHTILKRGLEEGVWTKIGKSNDLGLDGLDGIWFGNTVETVYDAGAMTCRTVDPLRNWLLWQVNKPVRENCVPAREILPFLESGGIFSFMSVNTRIKFGYYLHTNDVYDMIKRVPRPKVESFMKRYYRRNVYYYHFIGEKLYRTIFITSDGGHRKGIINGYDKNEGIKLWEINWKYYNFINRRDFEEVWDSIIDKVIDSHEKIRGGRTL